jgi:hypothetical protein
VEKRKGKKGQGKGGKEEHPAVLAATDRMKEVAKSTERMEGKRLTLEDERQWERDKLEHDLAKRRLEMEERTEVRGEKMWTKQERETQKEKHTHRAGAFKGRGA